MLLLVEQILSVVAIFMVLTIGNLVFLKNPHSLYSRIYFLLSLSLALLVFFNYLAFVNNQLIFVRTVLAFTSLSFLLFYFLIHNIETNLVKLKKYEFFLIFFTILVIILDFTKLVFIQTYSHHKIDPKVGWGIYLYVLNLFLVVILGLKDIFKNIFFDQSSSKLKKISKKQYVYLLIGALPIVIFAPITSFVLYFVFKNVTFNALTPVYPIILFGVIGFLIISDGLYRIQFYVVKGLIFLFSIALLILLLEVPAFLIIERLYNLHLDFFHFSVFIIIFSFIIIAYPYIERYYKKITDKIFYRDLYDVPKFISSLNFILIESNSLKELLEKVENLIVNTIKISFVEIYVSNNNENIINKNINDIDLQNIKNLLVENKQEIYNVESKDLFINDEISLIIPLKSQNFQLSNQYLIGENYIGFVVLGKKLSGQVYNDSDVNTLLSSVNSLSVAIQNVLQYDEIRFLNANLQKRIEEATKTLSRSNEKLRQLDESKDDFISMASHQLRTPLTSVKGYISMILEGDAGPINDDQKTMLEQAFFSSQKMVYLIADLLNLSRIKTGKFVIENKPCNLADLIEEEVNQLQQSAYMHRIELTYEKPVEFPRLMLDETKIRQVVMNFIDNAIYYTPHNGKGKIKVSLIDKKETIEFRVKDNGIGVAKKDQHRLFSKFYRADNAKTVRPDGTGLGLYMARKVIIGEMGSIIFDSFEGRGSTFGFILNKNKLSVE